MSFLNPVNEPVLCFKSTDAGAPQINYAARTAGDVKAVLKACLVTGYGSVASAGWSIVNEVDHVCEFVSPSAAMSDYRYKIDDASATTSAFGYVYQATEKFFGTKGLVNKVPSGDITKASPKNCWDLLATNRGFWFIQSLFEPRLNGVVSHYIYFGQVKSALANDNNKNICFFSTGALSNDAGYGQRGFANEMFDFFSEMAFLEIGSYSKYVELTHSARAVLAAYGIPRGYSAVQIADDVYIVGENVNNGIYPSANHQTGFEFVATLAGLRIRTLSYDNDVFSTYHEVSGTGRPVLVSRSGRISASEADFYKRAARGEMMIYTDFWEY